MSTLPGQVVTASSYQLGFDTDTALTAATAAQAKSAGYAFCLRYLSLSSSQQPGDLSNTEAMGILNAGLALMPVQHVQAAPWTPSGGLGAEYGQNAAANALAIGFPPGITVWCDLEGIASGAPASAVIDYCQSWYTAVEREGFIPGLYVGFDSGLSSTQLYEALSFQHFWAAPNATPVETRGYQMCQMLPTNAFGIEVDADVVWPDAEGGLPFWLTLGSP